jgi:hypothetical protein
MLAWGARAQADTSKYKQTHKHGNAEKYALPFWETFLLLIVAADILIQVLHLSQVIFVSFKTECLCGRPYKQNCIPALKWSLFGISHAQNFMILITALT